ncbi:hypothetical protein RirG_044820 [Rhizophagus irregularis DAOM 197198w]|uniref:Uncharacterized protein n=1 Tax=Rhizophagus irregularis (strain DAOM 197198w) TaxID=1432141 RepID=A0A015L634_RHIIW|nr:hypothetical protein RirG_044820 [Rhizophagus irregularis DAOM 197198w]
MDDRGDGCRTAHCVRAWVEAAARAGEPLVPKRMWQQEARCVVDGTSGCAGGGGRSDERGADDSASCVLRGVWCVD